MPTEAFNETKSAIVASDVRVASSIWSRFWGLMLRRTLPQGEGLLIKPCSSVHMLFMCFAIDVVFLDRDGFVTRTVASLKPWRVALGGRGAHAALELPSGAATRAGVEPGDKLTFQTEGD